ncbi:hypothetical protein ACXU4B_09630 [Dyella soli]
MTIHARDGEPGTTRHPSQASAAGQLSIQINDDRFTLAAAKVPQVYLFGVIDADAPNRFAALMRSSKIPPGSDVYLNSPGGDLNAGLSLGRLFRSGTMSTHLGTPRRPLRSGAPPTTALCTNACSYAYMGGLYRWAPSGNDRFGVQPVDAAGQKAGDDGRAADALDSYLKDMGVSPAALARDPASSGGEVTWLSAEQMMSTGLANNGRLPPTAIYHLMSGAPYLTLSQTARDGEHRITMLCKPDGLTLTAYYMIGGERSRRIAARGAHSYFEIDLQPFLQEERESISAVNQSVVITRPVPLDQLAHLTAARSMGAWLSDKGGAVRYGFALELDPVKAQLRDFRASCEQATRPQRSKKT